MPQRGRQSLRLALILVAAFMVVLDFSIVNVALPSIQRELGLSAPTVQWVITGYAIAFGGLLVLGGRAADLLGRRRMFIIGLLIFTAASLSGGLAHDPVLLIASRIIQGAGAALVAPSSLSLITTSFTDGQQRTRALGLYGATSSIGFVAGQVLGGVLVQFTSWRAVFLVNVPVGIIALLLAPKLLTDSRSREKENRLDARGAFLITAAMAALVLAVSEVDVTGWLSPVVLGGVAAFAVCTVGFVLAERRHSAPLLPAALMRRPALRTAASLNLLLGLWNGGEMLVLSLYFQQVLHDSPLETGLVIAPQGVIGFAAGIFGARLARRIGIQRVLVLTCAVAAAGFLVLARLPSTGHYDPLFLAVMLVGFGTAGTAFGTMVTATAGIAGTEQGVVGGVINTSRQIGAALGAAALPAIAEAAGHHQSVTASGTGDAMLAAAAAAAVGMLIAFGRLRARQGQHLARPETRHLLPAADAALAAEPAASTSARTSAEPARLTWPSPGPGSSAPVGAGAVGETSPSRWHRRAAAGRLWPPAASAEPAASHHDGRPHTHPVSRHARRDARSRRQRLRLRRG